MSSYSDYYLQVFIPRTKGVLEIQYWEIETWLQVQGENYRGRLATALSSLERIEHHVNENFFRNDEPTSIEDGAQIFIIRKASWELAIDAYNRKRVYDRMKGNR